MRFITLGNFLGIPAITFPAGYDRQGLPISFQLHGPHWHEHVLLRLANAAEHFVERKKPKVFYDVMANTKSS
jgi:Asp-tRNA(Asn)/Glu-tRNA(Gln) amidotransferase A subunit family amidase